MKRQPSHISTQLHQGIAGITVFLNYAVRESAAHFRAAFTHDEFRSALGRHPSAAVASPHLFTRVTVPNLCLDPQPGELAAKNRFEKEVPIEHAA